jgi:hypothetical protein
LGARQESTIYRRKKKKEKKIYSTISVQLARGNISGIVLFINKVRNYLMNKQFQKKENIELYFEWLGFLL